MHDYYDDDPILPAQGVVLGVAIGASMWIMILNGLSIWMYGF